MLTTPCSAVIVRMAFPAGGDDLIDNQLWPFLFSAGTEAMSRTFLLLSSGDKKPCHMPGVARFLIVLINKNPESGISG